MSPFPFLCHRTLAEVAETERLRRLPLGEDWTAISRIDRMLRQRLAELEARAVDPRGCGRAVNDAEGA